MNEIVLADYLPGRLFLTRGEPRDYRALESFHYLGGRPATWAGVWVVRFASQNYQSQPDVRPAPIVGVGVLSYPVPTCVAREHHFHLRGRSYGQRLRFANRYLRTISRVVVHPRFRSIGLASALVRCICNECPTRYVEALAVMGDTHPLFESGGMTRVGYPGEQAHTPSYFLFDRYPNEPQVDASTADSSQA
jgi:GNAT superfamily N-acetyltransferase